VAGIEIAEGDVSGNTGLKTDELTRVACSGKFNKFYNF
jgi:hypothetical protein